MEMRKRINLSFNKNKKNESDMYEHIRSKINPAAWIKEALYAAYLSEIGATVAAPSPSTPQAPVMEPNLAWIKEILFQAYLLSAPDMALATQEIKTVVPPATAQVAPVANLGQSGQSQFGSTS